MNTFKKFFYSILFLLIISLSVQAQPAITLEGFGGWLWTGSAGYNGSIKVDDLGNYGIRAGVEPNDYMLIEFEWNHTETNIHWFDVIEGNTTEPVIMNYYMLGFNKQMSEGPAVPYGLVNLGVMNLKGQTLNFSSNWFTVGLGGGIKYYFVEKVGIRLQARLLLPMQFAGIGFGCGGGGCGSSVSTWTSTIQGDFTGGLILKLGGG